MPTSTATSTAPVHSNTLKPPKGKPTTNSQPKKSRVVRRRGRARNAVDSDDEIEREAVTDSDSDDDHRTLSSPSDSDSDTEPASDDVVPIAPAPRVADSGSSTIDVDADLVAKPPLSNDNGFPSFFHPNGDWSDMVNDEAAHGAAELPVIDYVDFQGEVTETTPVPRNRKKPAKKAKAAAKPSAASVADALPTGEEQAVPSSEPDSSHLLSNDARRLPGHSARQAYQRRLESDPSYVPTVGEFWGHDDRLLDKNLRSLSGWWRGRWQGRGGRGVFGGGYGRGRGRGGGFSGSISPTDPENMPPVDREWTHDGFEEMKQREQQFAAFRGKRGGPAARGGRGLGRGFASASRGRPGPSFHPSDRPWYSVKPEKVWSKHHEGFLFQDMSYKRRHPDPNQFIRVKLSNEQVTVVKVLPQHPKKTKAPARVTKSIDEQPYVVRLPKKESPMSPVVEAAEPALPSLKPSHVDRSEDVEEVFKVRPHLVTPKPIAVPSRPPAISPPIRSPPPHLATPSTSPPHPDIVEKLERITLEVSPEDSLRVAQTEQAVLRNPTEEPPIRGTAAEARPTLPPLQTVFPLPPPPPPPVQQPTPPYGSPYGYPATLPPGIAMNAHGMPYEVSTGRPVYLQPAMPMYNTHPAMQAPFVPSHVHHRSTPDFYSHHRSPSHTPPVNGYVDPNLFSLPRSSRVHIRRPDGSSTSPQDPVSNRQGGGLNSAAVSFEPAQPPAEHYSQQQQYFSPGHYPQEEQMMDPSIMAYPGYVQYYYPEGGYAPDGYSYPPYMDMNQMYEMYPHPHDAQTAHGAVFY
jgi:hypothetical protein